MERVKTLRNSFERRGLDGFLIYNEANLLYFTGIPGMTCLLIPEQGEATIYVYATNHEQSNAEAGEFKVKLLKRDEDSVERIASEIKKSEIGKLGVDTLSHENFRKLADGLGNKTKIKMENELVWELRRTKDEEELKLMRKAAQLTSEGMEVAYEVVKPRMREYEVAAEIEYTMRRRGSWGTAFETIVASGVRSAFPHGGCTDRRIQEGDLVVFDIGAAYHYYRSDMTRTITAGKPSAKQARIHRMVKLAQEEAFQAVKSKVKAKEIDGIARKLIEDGGYGEYFVHGLGHGVGLEVHEPPALNEVSKDELIEGNVVTIEPGIYIVGYGGIRIEDTVLVQKDKGERLTNGPYTLETRQ